MPKIQIWGFLCARCKHEWVPRNREADPEVCPKCKSPYWDRPRKEAEPDDGKGKAKPRKAGG